MADMTPKSSVSRNPFMLLALEIRQAILCEISDIETLDAALAADTSFQSAFSGSPSLILDRVVHNIVPSQFLPEIHACLASRHFNNKTWSKDQVLKISANYFRRQVPAQIRWELDDIRFISNLHQAIQLFVEEFSNSALTAASTTEPINASPISSNERHRIMSTFYRFEIYSNLFRDYINYHRPGPDPRLDSNEVNDIFFSKFAPWENEQFACVYDHLTDKISPAFFDMAEHDVCWGECSIPFEPSREPEPYIERIISRGLVYLWQVQAATGYEGRHRLLAENPVQDDFVVPLMWDIMSDDAAISEYVEKYKLARANHCSTNDPDPGPYNAWAWAHATYGCYESFFSEDHRSLRRRGYVMWDNSRLTNEWDLFREAFEYVGDDTVCVSTYSKEDVKYSYARRSEIYRRGGSGWWSKDDESRIVWPKSNG